MGNLTDIALRAWIKAGQPVAKADGGGLTFTMSAHQSRQRGGTWVLRYRFGGKPRELTLGRYPDISLAVARQLAAEMRADDRVEEVRAFAGMLYETPGEDGWEAIRIEVGDYSGTDLVLLEGEAFSIAEDIEHARREAEAKRPGQGK